jgi:threonine dehydrogenase-like Zn-dependent dehydrogenase
LCKDTIGVGVNRDGAFAEYLVIPKENVRRCEEGVPEEMYAIFDPFGNAVHTALSFNMAGEDVLITGAGPIGIMAAAVCKFVGARHVVITDINDDRLELAKTLGIQHTVNTAREDLSVIMEKLNIKEGDSLLISGAGPIGILAGQWAKSFGADEVYYFDIDPKKIELAKQFGFREYKEGITVSCALEGTGHSDALAKCLAAMEPAGRIVFMGNPAGEMTMSQNTYWHILRKELTVCGTWNSSYNDRQNDWKESLKAMAEGKINVKPLITHAYPLEAVNQAFEMMKNKSEFFCKVILTMGVQDE